MVGVVIADLSGIVDVAVSVNKDQCSVSSRLSQSNRDDQEFKDSSRRCSEQVEKRCRIKIILLNDEIQRRGNIR